MCDLKSLQDVQDDLIVLRAVGEVFSDVVQLGGEVSAETLAGLGRMMSQTAQKVQRAIDETELACARQKGEKSSE